MTDTQYFPTDEIDQSPAEVAAADTHASQKDLAFLGCAIYFLGGSIDANCGSQLHFQAVYHLICFLNLFVVQI